MNNQTDKGSISLHLKCITWYKDSHSLFDYESTKVSTMTYDFPLQQKNVAIYRKRDSNSYFNVLGYQVIAVDNS